MYNRVRNFDFHRAISTRDISRVIQEDEHYQKYQEFMSSTGTDPERDICYGFYRSKCPDTNATNRLCRRFCCPRTSI